jgi:hypothetical protein
MWIPFLGLSITIVALYKKLVFNSKSFMDGLGSLRCSRRVKEKKEPYFGTYHHSTSTASKKIRVVVKAMFADAFGSLPFGREDKLMILDVGCGLGFLSCFSAEFYKNSRLILMT